MAKLKINSIDTAAGDGDEKYVKGLLSGEIGVVDFFAIMAIKGRQFVAYTVDVSTPTTFQATATVDVTKPALWGSAPSGTAIILCHAEIYMEAFGSNAQCEFNLQVGTGGSWTSGGTAITAVSTRSNSGVASACTWYAGDNSLVVVGSTANLNRFWRDGQQFAITKTTASATASVSDPNKFEWDAVKTNTYPIAVGAAQVALHQGSQAGTGFAKIVYVEFPSSWLP